MKRRLRIAGWALGLSLAMAGIGAAVGASQGAPVEAGADSAVFMTFDFEESTAHRTSGSNNYSETANNYSENSTNIELTYADSVTTGSPLSGLANVIGRVKKDSKNNAVALLGPIDCTNFKVTQVAFLAKSVSSLTVTLEYSTDNSTWNSIYSDVGSSTAAKKESSAINLEEPSSLYLRFTSSITNGGPSTSSNRDTQLDDIQLIGESLVSKPLKSISCATQNISVAGSVKLADQIVYDPTDTTEKEVSCSIKSGADVLSLEDSTVTGLKGGTAVVTITPTASVDPIDVTINVASLPAPDITVGNQYVLYAQDSTNGNFELIGLASSLGTAAKFEGDIPSCTAPLTVEAGHFENTVALKLGDKYLALDSAGNNIHSSTKIEDKSSWIVTVDGESGEASIKPALFQNRELQFNYNGGNARFAAYTLGNQTPVKLYSYEEKSLTDFTIESEVSVYVSETKGIQVTYVPADASDKDGIVWTSSSDAIATVDSDGKVTGVAVGDATITAKKTINEVEVSRTCTVHVLNNAAAHEGTQADPFTVNDAVNVTKGVFTKVASGAAVNLENTYYVRGILTNTVTRTTSQLTFWLGDNEDQQSAATGGFEIFRAGKVKGVNLADAFETNDDVANHFEVGVSSLPKAPLPSIAVQPLKRPAAALTSSSAAVLKPMTSAPVSMKPLEPSARMTRGPLSQSKMSGMPRLRSMSTLIPPRKSSAAQGLLLRTRTKTIPLPSLPQSITTSV